MENSDLFRQTGLFVYSMLQGRVSRKPKKNVALATEIIRTCRKQQDVDTAIVLFRLLMLWRHLPDMRLGNQFAKVEARLCRAFHILISGVNSEEISTPDFMMGEIQTDFVGQPTRCVLKIVIVARVIEILVTQTREVVLSHPDLKDLLQMSNDELEYYWKKLHTDLRYKRRIRVGKLLPSMA